MGDYSPNGRTKTGKSLKAVRRYYALKDAERKKATSPQQDEPNSPRKSNENDDNRLQKSKRKRSPDDGLSKRIANELRVQQDAIEMRSKRYPNKLEAQLTERSALPPIIIQPKEVGGPIFVTEPLNITKSTKSLKSMTNVIPMKTDNDSNEAVSLNTKNVCITFVIMCVFIGAIYLATWIISKSIDSTNVDTDKDRAVTINMNVLARGTKGN